MNPFDDDDDDDDGAESDIEDEDTKLFQECNEDYVTERTPLVTGVDQQRATQLTNNNSSRDDTGLTTTSAVGKKRTAPLNFGVTTTIARPALKFDEGSINTSEDFLSPLESEFLNQRGDLASYKEGEDDEDGESQEDTTNNQDSYFSVAYWSTFLYSPSNASSTIKETDDEQQPEKKDIENTTVKTTPTPKSKGPSVTKPVDASNNQTDNLQTTNTSQNPLNEALAVMKRMDEVSTSISKSINHSEILTSTKKKKKRKSGKNMQKQVKDANQVILSNIVNHAKDTAGTPWTRMIMLEQLGTAMSWVILLLPYMAFLIALFLDSDTILWNITEGPLQANTNCSITNSDIHNDVQIDEKFTFPLTPLPHEPCFYPYKIRKGIGLLSHVGRKIDMLDSDFMTQLPEGMAFSSGPMNDVPALSTFLYGDVTFSKLSSKSVDAINSGRILFSTTVFQQRWKYIDNSPWFPVSISRPMPLKVACHLSEGSNYQDVTDDLHWDCTSPRNVDVVFSEPDTSVLTGGSLRIDTIISLYNPQPKNESRVSFNILPVIKDLSGLHSHFNETHEIDRAAILSEIAFSASYLVTHYKKIYPRVSIIVRLITLSFTVLFLLFWFWAMGADGFLGFKDNSCCCNWFHRMQFWRKTEEENKLLGIGNTRHVTSWWECPWICFPERRYLLLLLLSLLLVQNPVLAYMYYHDLYGSAKMHAIADSVYGIGIHSLLCLWLCIIHGLRYHTAEIARKRIQQQKQIMELRQTAKYLESSRPEQSSTDSLASDYTVKYYEEIGDIDGTGFAALASLRFKHDPCGYNWLDFLFSKLLLFILGAVSVLYRAIYRYPIGTNHEESAFDLSNEVVLNQESFLQNRNIYIVSSLVHNIIIGIWICWILKEAIRTGNALRKEPFLSTRPAQLAYRVLTSIMMLGFASICIPFLKDALVLIRQWTLKDGTIDHPESIVDRTGEISNVDIFVQVIAHMTQHLPYSGNGLRPGEIGFITVSTLVAAFIFLPPSEYFDLGDDVVDEGNESENQRRDKRIIVTLAKYTHTWRVFPLPIRKEKIRAIPKIRPNIDALQNNEESHQQGINAGRGQISKGNYIPVFCSELALWLFECSWQVYYSPTEYKTDGFAPGKMNLDSIGLKLEASIHHEDTETMAFVSTNIEMQVDGEEDSIIVVAFRGTANTANLRTDIDWKQAPLSELFIAGSEDKAEYEMRITSDEFYDVESTGGSHVQVVQHNPISYTEGCTGGANIFLMLESLKPHVHNGFLENYLAIRIEIIEKVTEIYRRQLKAATRRRDNSVPQKLILPKIYICGHSMGGALAQLLALDIACNVEITELQSTNHGLTEPEILLGMKPSSTKHSQMDKKYYRRRHSFSFPGDTHIKTSGSDTRLTPPIAVYTFGQPRLGNRAFAKFYKAHVPHTFRVVNENDAITALPLVVWGQFVTYKHAGLDVILGEGRTGNTLVGPTVVETLFRFSKVRTNIMAHSMEEYRDGLESTLTQQELEEFYHGHGGGRSFSNIAENTSHVLPDWVTSKSIRYVR